MPAQIFCTTAVDIVRSKICQYKDINPQNLCKPFNHSLILLATGATDYSCALLKGTSTEIVKAVSGKHFPVTFPTQIFPELAQENEESETTRFFINKGFLLVTMD